MAGRARHRAGSPHPGSSRMNPHAERYPGALRVLHRVMACLIPIQFALGWFAEGRLIRRPIEPDPVLSAMLLPEESRKAVGAYGIRHPSSR